VLESRYDHNGNWLGYGIGFYATAQQLVVDWGDGSAPETYTDVKNNSSNYNHGGYVGHTYAENNATYTVHIKEEGLTHLDCYYNDLTALNVSGCTTLQDLSYGSNQLTALDVTKCPALRGLYCGRNQLTATALNTVFTALPNRSDRNYAPISIKDNPGTNSCNRAIAENKGWEVSY
jgi:hypothetical protein